jgi:hypothetical protein
MVNVTGGEPEALLSENMAGAFVVDLSDLAQPESVAAMAALEARIDAGVTQARAGGFARVWYRFPLASPGAGQTLFAPVGKALRARLSAGALVRAMPAATGGWIARLADRP